MISRRIFARALALAPAAMKAASAAGVSDGVGLGNISHYGGEFASAACAPDYPSHLAYLKGELARLIEGRTERLGEIMRTVSRLDPDIASNRSFSLSARIRLQAEREESREFARSRENYTRQIAQYAEKVLL